MRDNKGRREFLIRWKGYGPEHDQWRPRTEITPAAINEFLKSNDLYDYDKTARCPHCDRAFKNARGVKVHMRSCQFFQWEAPQCFDGTRAEQKVKENKLAQAQMDLDLNKVQCQGEDLLNTFIFKYLGSLFAADGNQMYDVRRRIGMAMTRMGQLRHVFSSKIILNLKLKVYKLAVCSLLVYGSEAWNLDQQTCAAINGANDRCLSRLTGKSAHQEASAHTRTYDLVRSIRKCRSKWLGHILRMQQDRMVRRAAIAQFHRGNPGNLFMDIPANMQLDEIIAAAEDRDTWKALTAF